VESDATSPSLEMSLSLDIIPAVTQDGDHVADQEADDNDEDQEQAMGDVQAVGRTRRNLRKPNWLTTNMVVVYAFPVIEEAIPSIYRKAEISLESMLWKDAMIEEMSFLHQNDTWDYQSYPRE